MDISCTVKDNHATSRGLERFSTKEGSSCVCGGVWISVGRGNRTDFVGMELGRARWGGRERMSYWER